MSVSGIPLIYESDASGEVAAVYHEAKHMAQTPFVPNGLAALGGSLPALKTFVAMFHAVGDNLTLPETLQSMISYTIATYNNCQYCSSFNELWCRSLGIDEGTLTALAADLGNVNPLRIRAILEFAVKCALHPKEMQSGDFDELRGHGVSDDEILELVMLSAFSAACDIVADALKVPVELEVKEALGR
jgi:uncharacterized peroxidase-related enzyme